MKGRQIKTLRKKGTHTPGRGKEMAALRQTLINATSP